jgi:hypothetical protein
LPFSTHPFVILKLANRLVTEILSTPRDNVEPTEKLDDYRPLLTSADRSAYMLHPSPVPGQTASPRGKFKLSWTAFRTQPPDLQPCLLMDMGFTGNCWLARRGLPQIRFLYIGS